MLQDWRRGRSGRRRQEEQPQHCHRSLRIPSSLATTRIRPFFNAVEEEEEEEEEE